MLVRFELERGEPCCFTPFPSLQSTNGGAIDKIDKFINAVQLIKFIKLSLDVKNYIPAGLPENAYAHNSGRCQVSQERGLRDFQKICKKFLDVAYRILWFVILF